MKTDVEKTDNELIAEFMGTELTAKDIERGWILNDLPWDTSWDWLMPVVEKIESIKGVHLVISELGCDIYHFGKHISNSRCATKIETVYKAVVEFIKFYNDKNKTLR